ncbi:MAG: hypothetical protein FD174_3067 [Geobacteraceae bacterium]|nr:MAG: hypothetical protein FD174_3067 [Geobacteraceae bacterium]
MSANGTELVLLAAANGVVKCVKIMHWGDNLVEPEYDKTNQGEEE